MTSVEKPRTTKVEGFADTNKIIASDRLKQGGKLLIIPFKAGAEVEASDELNKITLMMVKGIAEELQASNVPFKILTSEDADCAELIIKGHVVRMSKAGGIKKWLPGKNIINLKVVGVLLERESQDRLAVFSMQKSLNESQEDFKLLGYSLGKDIGRFIASGLN